jgi:hypothetical protein
MANPADKESDPMTKNLPSTRIRHPGETVKSNLEYCRWSQWFSAREHYPHRVLNPQGSASALRNWTLPLRPFFFFAPFGQLFALNFTICSCNIDRFFTISSTRKVAPGMYRVIRRGVVNHLGFIAIIAAIASVWGFLLSRQPPASISSGVLVWWTGLCLVSAINIYAWRLSAAALARQTLSLNSAAYVFQRRQLMLCAVYVLGCAFRAVLPRADVQRIGFLDSWISCILVGRTVATVAELCFALQWALLLREIAKNANGRFALAVSWIVVPLIVVAEIFSWYSVLTTAYIGNAIEESLWTIAATLITVSFLTLNSRYFGGMRSLKASALACGLCYVAFMSTVDIPMYVSRWQEDEANGRAYLSLGQGIEDVGSRRIVSFAWDHWHAEIPWMTLYFSVGVWISLALARLPQLGLRSEQSWLAARKQPIVGPR